MTADKWLRMPRLLLVSCMAWTMALIFRALMMFCCWAWALRPYEFTGRLFHVFLCPRFVRSTLAQGACLSWLYRPLFRNRAAARTCVHWLGAANEPSSFAGCDVPGSIGHQILMGRLANEASFVGGGSQKLT